MTKWFFSLLFVPIVAFAGLCVILVPCGDYVTYETKVPVLGEVWVDDGYNQEMVSLTYLKRLGVPDKPNQEEHGAVFGVSGLDALGGVPFSATTSLGDVNGQLQRGMFIVTDARKYLSDPGIIPPLVLDQLWSCYGIDNTGGKRQNIAWNDQFGPHDGTVGKPSYVCIPANTVTTSTFVCFGSVRNTGKGPGKLFVQTPFYNGPADVVPVDEYCALAS